VALEVIATAKEISSGLGSRWAPNGVKVRSRYTDNGLLIDSFVCHTGDDIAIIMTHTRGEGDSEVHQFAWKTFLAATSIAKTSGLYGAGQDLLADAASGNVRGAGSAVAELSFHCLASLSPAQPPVRHQRTNESGPAGLM
jgi:fructose 1,6-bisphosphatase